MPKDPFVLIEYQLGQRGLKRVYKLQIFAKVEKLYSIPLEFNKNYPRSY